MWGHPVPLTNFQQKRSGKRLFNHYPDADINILRIKAREKSLERILKAIGR